MIIRSFTHLVLLYKQDPYFLPLTLLIAKMISAIIPTTTNTPTHTPALKISPTNSQLLKETVIKASKGYKKFRIKNDLAVY